jgi:hypothetical protein
MMIQQMEYSMESEFTKLMDLYNSYEGGDNSCFFSQIPYELTKDQRFFIELENDLSQLDSSNYEIFKKDLLKKVGRNIRDKIQELKGFRYLKESGATNIKFLEPDNIHKTPDLLASMEETNDTILEVKSINVSDDDEQMWNELAKNKATAKSAILGLNDAFKRKIHLTIESAKDQLIAYPNFTENKIILLVIALDTNNALSRRNWMELEDYLKEIARSQSSVKLVWYYRRFGKDDRKELGLTGFLTL